MSPKKALIVLPNKDFDPTETSVPWDTLTKAGVTVDFCTEDGVQAECDPLLLTGVIFGQLGAPEWVKQKYYRMQESTGFKKPKKLNEADFMVYDAIILPGGHAQGMKQYLENQTIREKLIPFFKNEEKTVAAICHGTIVLSRTINPDTGKSILYNRKSTALPKYMERTAYFLTAWKLGRYYRTYDEYVEDEVKASMANPDKQFDSGPLNLTGSWKESCNFCCVDGNYVSARWPGDAEKFAEAILQRLMTIK